MEAREYARGILSAETLEGKLAPMREKLFAVREGRIHPLKDDKILTDWNGLMIGTLACAGRSSASQVNMVCRLGFGRFGRSPTSFGLFGFGIFRFWRASARLLGGCRPPNPPRGGLLPSTPSANYEGLRPSNSPE